MSADWIDDDITRCEAKRNADHQAAEVGRKRKELEDAEVKNASAQLPAVFEQLLRAVQADVELFNSKFPNQGQKHLSLPQRIGRDQFRVERKYDPTFWLNVTLGDFQISFIRIVSSRDQALGTVHVSRDLKLTLDKQIVSVEDISKTMLRPAVAALYATEPR